MNPRCLVALLLFTLPAGAALGQGAADRISTQIDTSRAQTESRYNKLGSGVQTETIVREKLVVPPAAAVAPVRTPKSADKSVSFLADQASPAKPRRPARKKPYVVRSIETIQRPAPLRINPY
jgi:hypothetical protein